MTQEATIVTREKLAVLLTAKDVAKKAMSAAYASCSAAADHTPEARLSLDLDRQRALNAYCKAETIYDAAVRDFLVNENH